MYSLKLSLNDLPLKVSSISISVLLVMLLSIEVRSQVPGVPLQGTYANYVDDGVDIFSGKLEQVLKLTSIHGRGELTEGLYLPLRNSEWTVMETSTSINNDKKYYYYRPDQTNYVANYPRTGYTTLGQLKIETKYTSLTLFETPTVTEVTFTTNKGSIIKFRDVLTNGQPYESRRLGCVLNAFQPILPPACSRGRVFRAIDGSNAIFVSDTEIYDVLFEGFGSPNPPLPQSSPGGTIFLSDGSRIRFDSLPNSGFANISRVTDRNGNYLALEYVTEPNNQYNFLSRITDSLNRQITISYGDNTQASYFDEIIYKGFAETERRIRINYTRVENAMAPGESLGTLLFPGVHVRCYYLSTGNPCDWTVAGGGAGGYATSIIVPSSVVLPNGQQYQFYYNRYLELARIKYPTGSYMDYGYAGTIGAGDDGFAEPLWGGGLIYRRVSTVKTYDDTGQLISEKDFSNIPQLLAPGYIDNATIDVKDANGALMSRSKHYFYDFPSMQSFYTFLPADYGKEYKTEALDPVTQNVLRRTELTWQQREEFQWCGLGIWSIYQCPSAAGIFGPAVDPRITEITTTLETGQVAKQVFTYDQYNNVTDTYQYDYGAGQIGPLLRRSHTDYITDPNYTTYTAAYLLRLPLHSWISSDVEGNNKLSFSQHEYDNYSSDAKHAPLIARGNVSGFDTNFLGVVLRGNPTAETRFVNAQNQTGPLTGYSQYDVLGNVVKSIDPRGFATTRDFSDRFGSPNGEARGNWDSVSMPTQLNGQSTFAFASSSTDPFGHTSYSQFDYSTGLVVDAEDINQTVTTFFYNDPLSRQTQIITANNLPNLRHQKSFVFDDVNRIITTRSDLFAFGDNSIQSETRYNSLGQITELRTTEPEGFTAVRSEYDALGRKSRTSNPFRPWNSETPIWTSYGYDALSRVLSLTTPDTAVVATTYNGNEITVTDQKGRQHRSVIDSIGRLVKVYEAPNNLNYLTSYTYDAVDDLIAINQGSQTRTQQFDSLKRMTSATSPESGNASYQYDENGNLVVKTDSRGVSVHFSYDALNRLVRRWYNSSSDPSAAVNNSPALPAYVTATPEAVLFYDSQTLPSGSPSFAPGACLGRLIAMTYGGGSAGDYFGYDALGRDAVKIQQTGGINYQISATYNLADGLTGETYPSGRTVTYTYDQAGRTTGLIGALGDGIQRTYSSSISYSSLGTLRQEQLGTTTPVWNKLFYNSRGQLSEIREGLTANDTSWQRGAIINHYSDGCWGMCGGQNSTTSMTDNDGNMKKQEYWIQDINGNVAAILTQKYQHDDLNRLQRVYDGDPNSPAWQQRYAYDRYGNRTIDPDGTFNAGVPTLNFGIDPNTNRLTPPAGHTITYDNVGNLIYDDYTGQGTRTYDAENRMTASDGTPPASYIYDAGGRRVKRVVGADERWQVFGMRSELIAEYSPNGNPVAPLKEYGYRNGQLLIIASLNMGWGGSPTFNDNPLQAGVTTVQARHITELRTAIDAVRSHFNLAPYSWQSSATTSDYIGANPILEMRTALDQALGAGNYAAGLAPGQPVKAVHIQELRDRILTSWQGGGSGIDLRWLISDQLGTPRMIFDQTGNLANVSRHDYLPFGEELPSGTNGRTSALGYAMGDGARQKFTGYEHDGETGLEYAHARYYASAQGRFTSADRIGGNTADPQSFNAYAYVRNNPINMVDPSGLDPDFSASWWDCFDVGVGNGRGMYLDGLLDNSGQAAAYLSSGAGATGPLQMTRYDETAGTFVTYTIIEDCGEKAGWIPPYARYLGGFTWGWLDWRQANEDGDPVSHSASFKSLVGHWRGGQWIFFYHGYIFDAYGNTIGVQKQGVETDWNAQLIMAAPFAAAVRASAGAGGTALKGAIVSQVPTDLAEQLALEEAEADGGAIIMDNLADAPRLVNVYGPGKWVKMQYVHRALDGSKIVIHWFKNLVTSQSVEYKWTQVINATPKQ